MNIDVRLTDFHEPEVIALVEFHLRKMYETSPEDSVFALDLDALRVAAITGFAARDGARLLGVGALKICADYGEVKSMRTAEDAAGMGAGSAILSVIEDTARDAGLPVLMLETGPPPHFEAANRFYEKHGFNARGPFGDYRANAHSRFYEKPL